MPAGLSLSNVSLFLRSSLILARDLIRSGTAGDWIVWDRVRRGPAVVGNRKLIRLSRVAAERALAALLAGEPETSLPIAEPLPRWVLEFGHEIIECQDEHEAKIAARKLVKKGLKIVARMISGDRVLHAIDGPGLRDWLSK